MNDELSKILKWVFLLIAIPGGLYLGKPFLAPLAIGVVLAMMLIPIMDWLLSKNLGKGWAVAGSTFFLLLFFIFLGGLITIQVKMISRDWPQIEKKSLQLLEDTQAFIEDKAGIAPDEQLQQAKTMLTNMGSGRSYSMKHWKTRKSGHRVFFWNWVIRCDAPSNTGVVRHSCHLWQASGTARCE